ncbi:MAG: hypothetical protein EBY21_14380, partial [Alphaproteobacteria bacterium]|nr:hypothetical protein [Alphaproteobacteria bacterium]
VAPARAKPAKTKKLAKAKKPTKGKKQGKGKKPIKASKTVATSKNASRKKPAKKAIKKAAKKTPAKAILSPSKPAVLVRPARAVRASSATYLRANGQALPLAQRHAKPGRRLRKANLLQRARPVMGQTLQASLMAPHNNTWLAADEAASETALRDRILVCLLALEGRLAGRSPEQGLPDWPKIIACYQQIWGWIAEAVILKDGRTLSSLLFEALLADELAMLRENLTSPVFDVRPFDQARSQLTQLCLASHKPD